MGIVAASVYFLFGNVGMIMKLLAALGIVFLFFLLSLVFAAIMTGLEDDTSPEDDEEQMQYIMRWTKDHEK